ncbi:hypothetical protein Trydic_g4675, partial [Trypoxylus dichotomus]
VSGKQP